MHRITAQALLRTLDRLDNWPVQGQLLKLYGGNAGIALTDAAVLAAVYGAAGGPLWAEVGLRHLIHRLRREHGAPLERARKHGYFYRRSRGGDQCSPK